MEAIKLFTPDQIREIDRLAYEKYNIPEIILMENAAYGSFKIIEQRFKGYKILVLCGPGNNGGDGIALARILDSFGWDVTLSFADTKTYKNSALINFKAAQHVKTTNILKHPLDNNTLIVDALFGIGLSRSLNANLSIVVSHVNNVDSPVLSLDIPSGIDGLTGKVLGKNAIKADITVTFCSPKIGLYLFPGADYTGEIICSKISIPTMLLSSFKTPYINLPILLPEKDRNCHKGSYGKILTIAGSEDYYGAPYFASKAALLAGAGNSTLITTSNVVRVCAVLAPEIIYNDDGRLEESINKSTAVVIGPGIGKSLRAKELLLKTLNSNPDNLIIDGDALTLLAEDLSVLKVLTKIYVITPHPREMARLLKTTTTFIEENRLKVATEFSVKHKCIVVLNGAYTVIAMPSSEILINRSGSVTLATAGSGDILCGIISGLTGRTSLYNAVKAGVYLHGLTGEILEESIGKIGVTASDLLKTIPESFSRYTELANNQ